jgi:peptidoglycan hydrolase CwlO-like protein
MVIVFKIIGAIVIGLILGGVLLNFVEGLLGIDSLENYARSNQSKIEEIESQIRHLQNQISCLQQEVADLDKFRYIRDSYNPYD